ncbi:hypothetical protein [Paraburkholderia sp. SOS3]|uniref:hypothetical protein n=1 Tax=Paraburkholderia sp. SOS3 TaxID=1926494 RepID=UPI0012EB4477|nr:hypothetical protein [Paraburkholderia sp. SOS3]
MLEGSRLLRTLSPDKQKQMMDFAMPYIALEAKLKGVSMTESTDAFIGLSHMAVRTIRSRLSRFSSRCSRRLSPRTHRSGRLRALRATHFRHSMRRRKFE